MKVGIIGGGPLAIEMSLQLNTLGAEVLIFLLLWVEKSAFFLEKKKVLF